MDILGLNVLLSVLNCTKLQFISETAVLLIYHWCSLILHKVAVYIGNSCIANLSLVQFDILV